MRLRVLAHHENDEIRIGAAFESEQYGPLSEIETMVMDALLKEHSVDKLELFYESISLVDSDTLQVVLQLYPEKDKTEAEKTVDRDETNWDDCRIKRLSDKAKADK